MIAVDRGTGRVVIASATWVDRDDQFLMGVQAVVVPGKGVAACQAAVDNAYQTGARGGGRGRDAVQVMTLTSSAWPDGGQIPVTYTQEGEDMSPPLAWSGAPEGVAS